MSQPPASANSALMTSSPEMESDDYPSSPEDSRALISPMLGAEPAWRVIDPAYGSRWNESFAFLNPEWSSLRTSQASCAPFLEAQASLLSESSSLVWPNSGMTLDGVAYELPMWEPHISVPESSFSLGGETLLPTPMARDGENSSEQGFRQHEGPDANPTLLGAARRVTGTSRQLLPTPQAADADGGRVEKAAAANNWRRPSGSKASKPLGTAVAMLPTPAAQEPGGTVERHLERKNVLDGGQRTKPTHLSLAIKTLPTPAATDGKGKDQPNREGGTSLRELGQLLPTPQGSDGERGPDFARQRERAETHGSGGDDLTTTVAKIARGSTPMLPTPVANPDNPGAGGELRAALTHGPGRRNTTGIDTWGRPNEGRPPQLLPTPTAMDAASSGGRNAPGFKGHAGTSLTDAVRADRPKPHAAPLLPTPQTRDGDETGRGADPERFKGPKSQNGRRSNLDDCIAAIDQKSPWIGESTDPPSSAGSPSPDPPLGQLTIADA